MLKLKYIKVKLKQLVNQLKYSMIANKKFSMSFSIEKKCNFFF